MRQSCRLYTLIIAVLLLVQAGCGKVDKSGPQATGPVAAKMQVALGAASIANGSSTTVTATVTDSAGLPVSGVNVSFSVISASAGSFAPLTAATNASGVATSQFTASPTGNDSKVTIKAAVTVAGASISGTASLTIGTPPVAATSVTIALSPTSVSATGGAVTVTATVTGASGPAAGAAVQFSASDAAAGTFSNTTATTNASGVATVTFTAAAGNKFVDIRATVGTLTATATLTIGSPPPPAATSMSLTVDPLTVDIQSQAAVSVKLLTSTGSPAFNTSILLTMPTGSNLGSFSPTDPNADSLTLTTDSQGVASATFYSGDTSGPASIKATSGSLTKTASINITSAPNSLTINIVNPNLQNGQSTNVVADVRNVLNTAVSDGTTVNFAITAGNTNAGAFSSGTGTNPGTASGTTVNGQASVTFTADAQNTGSIIITATAGAGISASALLTVSAAATQNIVFVEAVPQLIKIAASGGVTSSLVKFKVLDTNGNPKQGVSVNFALPIYPAGTTLGSPSGSTDQNGEVTAVVQSGNIPGTVVVAASVTLPAGGTINSQSIPLSVGGGVPNDRFFSVSAPRWNVEGLACDNTTTKINVLIADRFGNYNILQGTTVYFGTESGAIDAEGVADANGSLNVTWRSQDPRPMDVAPNAWETAANLFYVDGTGRTRNPRDGYATVFITMTGEEYFEDVNGNGVYDAGDILTDLHEPYIDLDDSGTYTAGDTCRQWPATVPGNTAACDGPNGVWDANIPIFRNVHLLVTGPPDGAVTQVLDSALGTNPVSIPKGATARFYVVIGDVNMNSPIGGTKVSYQVSSTKAAVKAAGADTLLDTSVGGPVTLAFDVTNNSAAADPSTTTSVTAKISYSSSCGSADYYFNYINTVTLQ